MSKSPFMLKIVMLILLNSFAAKKLLPDLIPMKIWDLGIFVDDFGEEVIGFGSNIMNIGKGALEVHSAKNLEHEKDTTETSVATQWIYDSKGKPPIKKEIGVFVWHPTHDHWHLNNVDKYAVYEAADDGFGGHLGTDTGLGDRKVTYCLRDSAKISPNYLTSRTYTKCIGDVQGISSGFTDFYDWYLDGQYFKSHDLKTDQIYYIVNEVNPGNTIVEADYTNNLAWTSFVIRERNGKRNLHIIAYSRCDHIEGACGEYFFQDNMERPRSF